MDAGDGMVGDSVQYLAEIQFRVEAVELGRSDQGVDRCGAVSARIDPAKR